MSFIRRRFLLIITAFCLSVGAGSLIVPATAEAKPPIPAGCPGSTRAGPPAPGSCSSIPAGCPGSSKEGKPKPEKSCPYADAQESAKQVADSQPGGGVKTGANQYKTINDVCGGTVDGKDTSVGVAINIGCKGKGNPIADATFAVIRIASSLVGLVIIGSIIFGGIQYIGSRGDPQSTALAVNRIRSSLFALLLFIFGYAILNFLIPAGFLG